MPEDGQGRMLSHMLLPSRSSFGYKAINLLSWCEAPIRVKQAKSSAPVGHMSVLSIRCFDFNQKKQILREHFNVPSRFLLSNNNLSHRDRVCYNYGGQAHQGDSPNLAKIVGLEKPSL
jgi:hypothetical protein